MPYQYKEDLTGRRFGMWTVTGYAGNGARLISRSSRWFVVCDCGKTSEVYRSNLIQGRTKSCGRHRHRTPVGNFKHGYCGTTEYNTWTGMRQRCNDSKHKHYKNYGGRGISVCECLMSFSGFISVLGDMPEGFSIDRIDNDGNYSCGKCGQCKERGWERNVQWATKAQQLSNRRVSRYLEHNGERLTISEWACRIGCSYHTLHMRLKHGWSVSDAIERSVRAYKS